MRSASGFSFSSLKLYAESKSIIVTLREICLRMTGFEIYFQRRRRQELQSTIDGMPLTAIGT